MNKLRIPPFQKYWLFVLIYIPLISVFWLLERTMEAKYVISCALDYIIPFVPVFALFYFVWFIYMFLTTAYFMFTSKKDFLRLTAFMAIGMSLSFVIYAVFPNTQPLRPEATGSGMFAALVSWLYSIDTPTNVCPSIHVINTIGVHVCICKSEAFSKNMGVKALSFITMLLINLSTMFIKQHSVIDVIAGVIAAYIIYCVVFVLFGETSKARPSPVPEEERAALERGIV